MFVLDDGDRRLLIPQAAHALLAWQLADHWGGGLRRPAPRAETLAAVLLHDDGWSEYDRRPDLDASGRPVTFDRMEPAAHLPIWEASVARARSYAPFTAMLVAAHHERLARWKRSDCAARGDGEGSVASAALADRLAEAIDDGRRALGDDPRFAPFLDGTGWETAVTVLGACDRISVDLCRGAREPFAFEAVGSGGVSEEIRVEPVPGGARLTPWPFVGRRLDVAVAAVDPARRRWADRDELAADLAEAPRTTVRFRLRPRSG